MPDHIASRPRTYIDRLKAAWWPSGIVTLAIAVLAGGLTPIFVWLARQRDLDAVMPEFIGLLLLAGILYVTAVFLAEKFRLGAAALLIILAGAVLFRVTLLTSPLAPSGDVYRYQWDGRVQRAHLNPYVVYPNSPGLEWLQNPEHPEPPGEDTPTIYPPLSELIYRLIETIPGYKRASVLFDLGSIGILMLLLASMKQPLHRVLAYAWNPTVLIAFAMSGHFDSLAIVALLTALLLLLRKRPALSTAAFALSFLSKFFPILLLPVFLKRVRARHLATFAGIVLLFYVPFLGAGLHLFEGATNYARDWVNNASLFHLLGFMARSKIGGELLAGSIVLAMVGYLAKRNAEPLWSALVLTCGVLLVSPTAYPWYFTWSIPFLCFYPNPAWLLMSVTSVLAYTPTIRFGAEGPLKNSFLILSLEYGSVYLWLIYHCVVARAKGQPGDKC
ncbi:MAG TPA: glycosyltransferase 87 family protein [Candidatus Acidoferrales bacterium]|nr:glycosyltransferase 87 family protein [Candidatus Acidoferrales bacterium]